MAAVVPVVTAFLVLDVPGGFQFRNAVQILHGLPSGPMTIPGGNGSLLEVSGVGWLGSPIMLVGGKRETVIFALLSNNHACAGSGICPSRHLVLQMLYTVVACV